MYSPRTGEELDFSARNVAEKTIRTVGGLAVVLGAGVFVQGLWEHNIGHAVQGVAGAIAGGGTALRAKMLVQDFKDFISD